MTAPSKHFLRRGLVAAGLLFLPSLIRAGEPAPPRVLFDFAATNSAKAWGVEDDVVMGGRSQGVFELVPGRHAVFSGTVSLENNGGFSSVQADFDPVDVSAFRTAKLRVKGDGKSYRFIVESDPRDRVYYVHEFPTGTDWQTVTIPLRTMKPMRRGDPLDLPDYPGSTLSQVRLMIANGRAEDFRLEIGKIWLE